MQQDWAGLVDEIEHSLVTMDRVALAQLVTRGAGTPLDFVEKGLAAALDRIGKGWEDGELALSQVYMSARLCERMVAELLPDSATSSQEPPRLALGVLLDHHALGKRIVHSVLRSAGCAVLDYGHGLSVDAMVERTVQDQVEVLLISTLMHASALKVGEVRRRLEQRGARVKIVVGGAPFILDRALWREVGADAMGVRASEAPALVRSIRGGTP